MFFHYGDTNKKRLKTYSIYNDSNTWQLLLREDFGTVGIIVELKLHTDLWIESITAITSFKSILSQEN